MGWRQHADKTNGSRVRYGARGKHIFIGGPRWETLSYNGEKETHCSRGSFMAIGGKHCSRGKHIVIRGELKHTVLGGERWH